MKTFTSWALTIAITVLIFILIVHLASWTPQSSGCQGNPDACYEHYCNEEQPCK